MAVNTKEMISCWVEFAKKASNAPHSGEAGLSMKYFRDFLAKVSAFNDDPTNVETRPYFFLNRLNDSIDPVAESDLNRLLLDADAAGIAGEFLKDRAENGDVTLYFSHAASSFASDLCEKYGLGFASMGSKGICVPGFAFSGLATATPDQLKTSLIEANAYLAINAAQD